LTLETKLQGILHRLDFFDGCVLEYCNFQLKNGEREMSETILKKSRTVFMPIETGFCTINISWYNFRHKKCVTYPARKLSMCCFHIIYIEFFKNRMLFLTFEVNMLKTIKNHKKSNHKIFISNKFDQKFGGSGFKFTVQKFDFCDFLFFLKHF
jgi:hypothetical protein